MVDAFRLFDGVWEPAWLCEQAAPGLHSFLGLTLKRRANWLAGDNKEGFRVVICMLDLSIQPPLLSVLTPLMLCLFWGGGGVRSTVNTCKSGTLNNLGILRRTEPRALQFYSSTGDIR